MKVGTAAFFSLLSVPILAWTVIVLLAWIIPTELPALVVWAIVRAFPLVRQDIGIVGEITPAVLAASVLALVPALRPDQKAIGVLLAAVTYILYMQMALFFSSPYGVSLIEAHFDGATNIADAKKTLLNLISNIRTSSLFILSSIIGLNIDPIAKTIANKAKRMKSTKALLVFAAFTFLIVPHSEAAESKYITVTIKNETPNFPVLSSFEGLPAQEVSFENNARKYKITIPPDRWFSYVTIVFKWKEKFERNDEAKNDDFEQRISLRIRRDLTKEITIPVFFGNSRTDAQITNLGNPPDSANRYKVHFRSIQIAFYYMQIALPAAQNKFRTTAKLAFYALAELADPKDVRNSDLSNSVSVFEVKNDAIELIRKAFPRNSFGVELAELEKNALQANSTYWRDFNLIGKYVNERKCDVAWLIFNDLKSLKDKNKEEFEIQRLPTDDMEAARKNLMRKCKPRGLIVKRP